MQTDNRDLPSVWGCRVNKPSMFWWTAQRSPQCVPRRESTDEPAGPNRPNKTKTTQFPPDCRQWNTSGTHRRPNNKIITASMCRIFGGISLKKLCLTPRPQIWPQDCGRYCCPPQSLSEPYNHLNACFLQTQQHNKCSWPKYIYINKYSHLNSPSRGAQMSSWTARLHPDRRSGLRRRTAGCPAAAPHPGIHRWISAACRHTEKSES